MKNNRVMTWFIFTNDSYTNEVISRQLPQEPENINNLLICSDGVERQLWECDGPFVTKMYRNKKRLNLHFDIFKKEGKYGPIKKCDFLRKKKKSLN